MTEKNYLDMPDEEVMGMSEPTPVETKEVVAPVVPAVTTTEETPIIEGVVNDEAPPVEAGVEGANGDGHNDDGAAGGGSEEVGVVASAADGTGVVEELTTPEGSSNPTDNPKEKTADNTVVAPAIKSYSEMSVEEKAAAFDRMTAPFKANGRMVETKSVEEEIQLKQMGANFTKKMQELQPRLRIIKMLENNNLLDENKLSHLIDLDQKKPLAIQKLLDSAEFDPLSVDKEQAASYTPGNHQVSDAEMAFQTALDDVEATETGSELIVDIAKQYDPESKQALYQNPELVRTLNQQRANGIYAQIDNEIHRLKALGQIGPQTPYLQAYYAVGDMLNEQGKLVVAGPKPVQQVEQVPVETRTVAPTQKVVNNERATAAAPTRASSPTPVATDSPDILNVSDEAFLKQMEGRV